jgi:hypothetical protein
VQLLSRDWPQCRERQTLAANPAMGHDLLGGDAGGGCPAETRRAGECRFVIRFWRPARAGDLRPLRWPWTTLAQAIAAVKRPY